MTTRLAHRGIGVQDLDRSGAFYRDALGYQVLPAAVDDASVLQGLTGQNGARVRTACVGHPGGAQFELAQFVSPAATGRRERRALNEFGITHLCFWSPNVEETARQIERHGGTAHWHTFVTSKEFSTRVMYCTDPDGTRIELGERPNHPFEFLHSGLCVHQAAATIEFYRRVLGYEKIEEMELTEHGHWLGPLMELDSPKLAPRVLAAANGDRIEVLELYRPAPFGSRKRPAPNRYGLTHMTYIVDSLQEAAAAALDAGAVESTWHTGTADSVGSAFVCADPNGALLILVERGY